MIYAYIRVSTDTQHLENQKHEISTFCESNSLVVDSWIAETISSRKALKDRKLNQILRKIKKGDILITTEITRLGRSLFEVMSILQKCMEKDCQVWTLKENYRLGTDLQSKVLAFAFTISGEIERQMISERTKQSLKRLRDEGKHLGRPYGFSYKKLKKKHKKIIELLSKGVSKSEIARLMNCTWQTLHRYIKEFVAVPDTQA
jgi:DNA invertase Pin-like site-specific DNA recombinase